MSLDHKVLRKTGGTICSASGCAMKLHPQNPYRWCAQHIDVEYYRVMGKPPPKGWREPTPETVKKKRVMLRVAEREVMRAIREGKTTPARIRDFLDYPLAKVADALAVLRGVQRVSRRGRHYLPARKLGKREPLGDGGKDILRILADGKTHTRREFDAACRVKHTTVTMALQRLIREGRIKRVSVGVYAAKEAHATA